MLDLCYNLPSFSIDVDHARLEVRSVGYLIPGRAEENTLILQLDSILSRRPNPRYPLSQKSLAAPMRSSWSMAATQAVLSLQHQSPPTKHLTAGPPW